MNPMVVEMILRAERGLALLREPRSALDEPQVRQSTETESERRGDAGAPACYCPPFGAHVRA